MLLRRTVLGAMLLPALGWASTGRSTRATAEALTGTGDDADWWSRVAASFAVDRSVLNLNNGGVSPTVGVAHAALQRHEDAFLQTGAHALWRDQLPRAEAVRQQLGRAFGADPEELALVRNASEGLQILQQGLDLKRGDEILTTDQDYPRMLQTFRQREQREGVVLKTIRIPTPAEDPAEVVRRYEAGITKRTRMILVCHMINLTGQILPVKAICALGRERGIPVIVDGAHALAHFDFRIDELGCDFYASSLHKWLFAPLGTGLLYVRRDRIGEVWPLQPAPESQRDDIRKFEEIGTHPVAPKLAIAEALQFHDALGAARKEARLVALREHWMGQLEEHPRVRFHTPRGRGLACGIGNVQVDGMDTADLQRALWAKHRIITTTIQHAQFEGLRVSPSVYTTFGELDRFCDAVRACATA